MGETMKINQKTKLALAFLLAPFALLLAPFVIVPKWHDHQLSVLQREIAALRHPANSVFAAKYGEVNNFANGNHIDFWAIEVRSISGSRAPLQSVYNGVRVAVPNSGDDDYSDVKNGTQPVEIVLLPSPLPANYHLHAGNSKWNLNFLAGRQGLYTVEIVNSGDNNSLGTAFDGRGW